MYDRPYTVIEYEKMLAGLSDKELDGEAKRAVQDPNIYWKASLLHAEYQSRKRMSPVKMSMVVGHGYGDSHEWEQPSDLQYYWTDSKGQPQLFVGGPSVWRCRLCGATFKHYYHQIRDIFEAIKQAGVPDVCPWPVPHG